MSAHASCSARADASFQLPTTCGQIPVRPESSAIFVRYDPEVSVTKMPLTGADPKQARKSRTRVRRARPWARLDAARLGRQGKVDLRLARIPGVARDGVEPASGRRRRGDPSRSTSRWRRGSAANARTSCAVCFVALASASAAGAGSRRACSAAQRLQPVRDADLQVMQELRAFGSFSSRTAPKTGARSR